MMCQAHIAQQVEHILGKDEVIGSNPIVGSIFHQCWSKTIDDVGFVSSVALFQLEDWLET